MLDAQQVSDINDSDTFINDFPALDDADNDGSVSTLHDSVDPSFLELNDHSTVLVHPLDIENVTNIDLESLSLDDMAGSTWQNNENISTGCIDDSYDQ